MVTLQSDGNLCLYKGGLNGSKQFVWCNGIVNYGQNPSTGVVMQIDGNFVLYKNVDRNSDYIWSTKSNGQLSGYTALLKNDGNFVVYDAFYKPVWSTKIEKEVTEYTLKDCQ